MSINGTGTFLVIKLCLVFIMISNQVPLTNVVNISNFKLFFFGYGLHIPHL